MPPHPPPRHANVGREAVSRDRRELGDDDRMFRSWPFARLWGCNFLGSAQYHLLQTLVPLIIVERGGDAALVGLAAIAFSGPSVVARPVIGRAVDVRGDRAVLAAGSAVLAAAALIYAIPATLALFVGRIIQGIGWGAFNTGGYALLARLAPVRRRGEAAGYYAVAPAVAQLIMPGLAIWLYASTESSVAVAVAVGAAVLGLGVISIGRSRPTSSEPHRSIPIRSSLTERSALLPMALESVNSATQAIFTFFMPVIVLGLGLPIEQLAIYYPAYGVVLVAGRILSSRASDRIGREPALIVGAAIAIAALVVAAISSDMVSLGAAGCLAALSGALITPTVAALTIDRAPEDRIGAAVATYSLGYQIGAGLGGAAWGYSIVAIGTRSPFVLAALIQLAVLAWLWSRRPKRSPVSATRGVDDLG